MTRDETHRLPENLARQVLARAAELDASDRVSVSIPDLRSAAVEAGISQRALDQALGEVEAMEAVSPEPAHEKTARRFQRRFIAAVAVIAILIVLIGTMTMVVPRTVIVSSEEAPAEIEIPTPSLPPAPPPTPAPSPPIGR